MDADQIRLILLILGVCLIAGIWVWDRWQRNQGEPPMVRRREPEEDESNEPEEPAAEAFEPDDDEPESELQPSEVEIEPEPEPHLYLDRDEAEPEPVDAALPSEPEPEPPPAITPPPASEPAKSVRKPAWVQPAEPVIPAFLVASEDELEPDSEPLAPEPEPEPVAPRVAERREPSLMLDTGDEPDIPVLELAPEPIDAPARPARSKAREPDSRPKAKPAAEPVSIRSDEDQFDLDLGFSAVDDQDLQEVAVDLPDLIVQINIVAKGEPFSGEQVLAAMDQVEMRAGEHDIFHRYDNRAARGQRPKSLFSLASLVEPGNFPLKKMTGFSTPGLTLFTQLPGPRDGLLIYSDMLYVAERLARLLDARLKDENRSTLTKQTIEHTRERIAEHKRQITLKLRQAGDSHKSRR